MRHLLPTIATAVAVAVAACGSSIDVEPVAHDPATAKRRPSGAVAADARRWEALADYEFPRTLPPPEPAPSPTSDSGWCVDYTGWCLEQGDLTEPADVDRLTVEAWDAIVMNYGDAGCNRRGDPADCLGPISGRYRWTADDHRVVARAWERLADNYERHGDARRARRIRQRAREVYAEADRVETGRDPSTTSTP